MNLDRKLALIESRLMDLSDQVMRLTNENAWLNQILFGTPALENDARRFYFNEIRRARPNGVLGEVVTYRPPSQPVDEGWELTTGY